MTIFSGKSLPKRGILENFRIVFSLSGLGLPLKTIPGIELKKKFHEKFKTKFLYEIGETKDAYDELNEEYNLYSAKFKNRVLLEDYLN